MKKEQTRIFRDIPKSYFLNVNHYVSKLKEACEKEELPLCYGPYLKNKKGQWLEHMKGPNNKLILEIGCHKGKNLCQMAEGHKDKAFIGFDITYKRVYETALLAQSKNLENLKAIYANAKEMEEILAPGELDGVVIFFPDPWIKKKKQTKKRLLNQEFCAILKRVLKPGGFIWFKTDSHDYFMNTENFLSKEDFTQSSLDQTCFTENYESTFEKRFKEKGEPTYESVWINPGKTLEKVIERK